MTQYSYNVHSYNVTSGSQKTRKYLEIFIKIQITNSKPPNSDLVSLGEG